MDHERPEVRWDSWSVVQDTIKSEHEGMKLVGVMWSQPWNPMALHAAECMETIRSKAEVDAQLFIVDKDKNPHSAAEYEVTSCPSLTMYYNGKPVVVRRCFRADSKAYVGSLKKDGWVNVLKEGIEAGKRYDSGETFFEGLL
mmetsp:Transcript_16641/g.20010  ORF Transcript_16641/g.20010 Transcript_16641/m.20010 type:complete len:142 (-) Transcript_16641:3-428(-)